MFGRTHATTGTELNHDDLGENELYREIHSPAYSLMTNFFDALDSLKTSC